MAKSSTSWTKGQSGNPGGRKGVPPEYREAMGALYPRAVEVLAQGLGSPDEEIRVACAKYVADQVIGKATQKIAGDDEGAPVRVSLDIARARLIQGLGREPPKR
jgi:hypothetical protein